MSLLGRVAGVQRPAAVLLAGFESGGEGGVQGLETCHGNPASPATCALEITQLQLRERDVPRATEQTGLTCEKKLKTHEEKDLLEIDDITFVKGMCEGPFDV